MTLFSFKNKLSLICLLIVVATSNISCVNNFVGKNINEHELSLITLEVAQDSISSSEFINKFNQLMPESSLKHKYKLKVSFLISTSSSVISKDTDTLRENITQIVNYSLVNIEDDKVLTQGKIRQNSSHNAIFSPFSTFMDYEGIKVDLGISAAEEVYSKINLYFLKENNKKT